MSDQTHGTLCNNHLLGRGNWCTTCAAYMHVKSSGLNQASDQDKIFNCIRCNSLITDNTTTDIQATTTQPQQSASTNDQTPATANSNDTVTATPGPWSSPTPELKVKIRTIFSQVVHRKSVFMILAKNRTESNFIETVNRTLNSLIETQENTYAMHATMTFPHLMLCKTKKSESLASNSNFKAKRLKQWQKGELGEIFNERKALQMRLAKSKKKK